MVLLVWLVANLTMWMNDVASAWRMATLTDSAVMVAMVQSASTLPLFLLGLPSGAVADRVDRRRYLAFTQVWVGAIAVVLAALSFGGALSAPALLACTALNGIGMAMRWPLFACIVPELVCREELPAALALNGVAANLSRIVAPVIAGALLACAGSGAVYLLNAVLSVVALVVILRWRALPRPAVKPPVQHALPPTEPLLAAMWLGLRHVMHTPPLRAILVRIFLFFLQATALTALLPLVARRLDDEGASTYTTLLVAMGGGAMCIALLLPRLRRRAGPAAMVTGGTCVYAAASIAAALAPTLWLAVPAMAAAGMAWLATANTLTTAMQLALPNAVRARGMAIYQMAVMGGSAAGAAGWGYLASCTSVQASICAAALLGALLCMLLQVRARHDIFD